MAKNRFKNASFCKLSDYVPSEKFRTVLPKQRTLSLGISEIPADIHLGSDTISKLSFQVPWDGDMFGCLRDKESLKKALKTNAQIQSISLSDWDDKFLLIFNTEDVIETIAFYVTQEEVINLLENCLRVPEQR